MHRVTVRFGPGCSRPSLRARRAWRAIGSFRADAKLSTWLVLIVINEALGRVRKRGAEVLVLDAAVDPHPESFRTVFMLRAVEELSV